MDQSYGAEKEQVSAGCVFTLSGRVQEMAMEITIDGRHKDSGMEMPLAILDNLFVKEERLHLLSVSKL